MRILYLIPARAGSKGLPNKNFKLLGAKPLLEYSIDFAKQNMKEGDILCISTNDAKVIEIAKKLNVEIPFIRPNYLSSDNASSNEVILHAIDFYENKNEFFDFVLLLQPTSPFRIQQDFLNLMNAGLKDADMIASVKKSKENPYFNLFEENQEGFLDKSKVSNFTRRQDCPLVYAFNGSLYLIRVASIKLKKINEFTKVKKILMPEERSVDIDTMADWLLAEYYLNKNENS